LTGEAGGSGAGFQQEGQTKKERIQGTEGIFNSKQNQHQWQFKT